MNKRKGNHKVNQVSKKNMLMTNMINMNQRAIKFYHKDNNKMMMNKYKTNLMIMIKMILKKLKNQIVSK